jgi:hypothetical protein
VTVSVLKSCRSSSVSSSGRRAAGVEGVRLRSEEEENRMMHLLFESPINVSERGRRARYY